MKEHSRELYAKRRTCVREKQNITISEKQQCSKNIPISICIKENTNIGNQKGNYSFTFSINLFTIISNAFK